MRASKASTGLRLREATSDDVPALLPLLAELGYPTDNAGLKRRFDTLLADDGALVLVAEEGGHIVGLASMHVMPLIEREPVARLSAIVVAASHRRAGVGRALMRRVESEARARGCERLELTSAQRRADAHAFYSSLGFEPASQRFLKSLVGHGE